MSQQSAARPKSAPDAAHRHGWWRDAVIYQVYPRSFADSNGDGMGDLEGIRSRLGYLRDLGVDALWLSPFYASPQADAGYDVADYRTVDPMFGNLRDADALIRRAHELGLRVIVDLVPNHSSDRHDWFRRALEEGPGSPMRERYWFRDGTGRGGEHPPNDWESVFGGSAWTRVPDGQWYLHLFAAEQPDFNWEHPAVNDEFRTVLRFWLDIGVDGFRVDVAHGLVKAHGLPDVGHGNQVSMLGNKPVPFFDQDGVHDIYREWHRILDEYSGERIFVAEAWTPSLERTAQYVRPGEMHQAFNFQYLTTYWDAAELREIIDRSLDAMRPVGATTTWVLSNHDVTRHATRYANPPGLGVQLRSAGDVEVGQKRARAASLLMLALPGSAYVYQGEELGLPDVVDLPDEVRQDPSFFRAAGQEGYRDGCRVPIPWTVDGPSHGFGAGAGWLPQPEDWGKLSIQAQTGVPGSTLELYRTALALRREHPALGAGDAVQWLDAPEGVLSFRRLAGPRAAFVCTANTTGRTVRVPAEGNVVLTSDGSEITVVDSVAEVPPDTTVWWSGV